MAERVHEQVREDAVECLRVDGSGEVGGRVDREVGVGLEDRADEGAEPLADGYLHRRDPDRVRLQTREVEQVLDELE